MKTFLVIVVLTVTVEAYKLRSKKNSEISSNKEIAKDTMGETKSRGEGMTGVKFASKKRPGEPATSGNTTVKTEPSTDISGKIASDLAEKQSEKVTSPGYEWDDGYDEFFKICLATRKDPKNPENCVASSCKRFDQTGMSADDRRNTIKSTLSNHPDGDFEILKECFGKELGGPNPDTSFEFIENLKSKLEAEQQAHQVVESQLEAEQQAHQELKEICQSQLEAEQQAHQELKDQDWQGKFHALKGQYHALKEAHDELLAAIPMDRIDTMEQAAAQIHEEMSDAVDHAHVA